MTGGGEPTGDRDGSMLLGIYLNDHLGGATGGLELARRTAGAHRGQPPGAELDRIAREIAEDRDTLIEVMRTLGVPVRQYKVLAGWAAERVGRLKLNGRVLERSPLSSVIELEGLQLGVRGKWALWRTLRALAEDDARLDPARLDGLVRRAEEQVDTLERLRVEASAALFR
jgi:hypothetical protein